MEAIVRVAGLFTGIAAASFFNLEAVKSGLLVVAGRGFSCFTFVGGVVEIKPFGGIVSEKYVDHLLGVVDSIVALEVKKACRAPHRAH